MSFDTQKKKLFALFENRLEEGEFIEGNVLYCPEKTPTSLVPLLQLPKYILNSSKFTHLPALFDTTENFPIADMYVELTVAQSPKMIEPRRVQCNITLAEEQEARRKLLTSRHLSIEQCINNPQNNRMVILGDPGSGKTSLLKYICLTIAKGGNTRWTIPLFISLKSYWADKQRTPDLTFLHYIAITLITQQKNSTVSEMSLLLEGTYQKDKNHIVNLEQLLKKLSLPTRDNVLFLLDGFDEVATQTEAIATLSEDIKQLGHFSWILSSRHTGYYGGLEEDVCYEILSLNKEGTEELVNNWFSNTPNQQEGSKLVLQQIHKNSRLRDMAKNPFLLTLLCYVQKDNLEKSLPSQRTDIYKNIIQLIRRQLISTSFDNTLLQKQELDYLAKFCHFLYTEVQGAPLQVFEYDHWNSCALPNNPPVFDKHFLPSRLINSWTLGGNFHFTHLTFQEYFIALHLSSLPFEHIKHHLFSPHWKIVYRFLAGLYATHLNKENYTKLIQSLLSPVDKMGLLYIEAANLLTEGSYEDSSSILGYDLRDILWDTWCGQANYVKDSAGEALSFLSPNYVLGKISELLNNYSSKHKLPTMYAIRLLGFIDTTDADELIFTLLHHDDQLIRAMTISSIAEKNTESLRSMVIDLYLKDQQQRFSLLCEVAKHTKHKVFIPYLRSYLRQFPENLDEYKDVFSALKAIGDIAIDEDLFKLLSHYSKKELTDDAIDTFISLRTELVTQWVASLLPSEDEYFNETVVFHAIQHSLFSTNEVIYYLTESNNNGQNTYLSAILHQIKKGTFPNRRITQKVFEIAFSDSPNNIRALTVIEQIDFKKYIEGKNILRYKSMCRKFMDHSDIEMAVSAISILSTLKDMQSFPKIKSFATDTKQNFGIQSISIIALAKYKEIYSFEIIAILHDLYKKNKMSKNGLLGDILKTLAKVNLQEIVRYLDTEEAQNALMEFCATEGILLFSDYYIDQLGNKYKFSNTNQLVKIDSDKKAVEQLPALRSLAQYLLDKNRACLTSANRNANPLPLFTKIERGVNSNNFDNGVTVNTGRKFLKGGKIGEKSAYTIMLRLKEIAGEFFE